MNAATPPLLKDKRLPILYNFLEFRQKPLQFWLDAGKVAPVVRVRFGPSIEYWVVTDPEWMQHVLQRKAKTYIRERRMSKTNNMGAPELMFNTPNWEEWLWRRRLMQPAFHRKQIAQFADTMVAETVRLVDEWHLGQTIELQHVMKTLTMRIIGKTMFSADVTETDLLQHAFEVTSRASYKKLSAIARLPDWMPTKLNRETQRANELRLGKLRQIVEDRFASGQPQGDLLDMLISNHLEEDGRRFSAEQLIYEMSGIVFAGHDTTALTLTWLFYLLSQHEDVMDRVSAEIETVLGNRLPTLDDLDKLTTITHVIQETLRLYPPVYVTIREADEEDNFGGYHIPKGTSLLLNIRGLHRDPTYWHDPETFNPDRFAKANSANRHKSAFIPFITGPRKCIGDNFAMMEMQLVAATLLQRVRLRYAGKTAPIEKAGFVMESCGVTMQIGSV